MRQQDRSKFGLCAKEISSFNINAERFVVGDSSKTAGTKRCYFGECSTNNKKPRGLSTSQRSSSSSNVNMNQLVQDETGAMELNAERPIVGEISKKAGKRRRHFEECSYNNKKSRGQSKSQQSSSLSSVNMNQLVDPRIGSTISNANNIQCDRNINRHAGRQIPIKPSCLPLPRFCRYCQAKLFAFESEYMCCQAGKVKLVLNETPEVLRQLFLGTDTATKHFQLFVRAYNNHFAFTSFGVKRSNIVTKKTKGIYTFKVQGQIYHYIDNLSSSNENRRYFQLYFYDPEVELQERINVASTLNSNILASLISLMNTNPYASFFRMLQQGVDEVTKVLLMCDPFTDQRVFNLPRTSDVAGIWIEDSGPFPVWDRDIIVIGNSGHAHKIQHFFGCYDPLQYPLLFSLGEGGFHRRIERFDVAQTGQFNDRFPIVTSVVQTENDLIDIENAGAKIKVCKKYISCREYYAYKLQIRQCDQNILLHSGRLLQRYLDDMYVKLDASRLNFLRDLQQKIRMDYFQGLLDSFNAGQEVGANCGRGNVLPSTYCGGPRDMYRR